ncbi:MAG TPA: dihydropteroate synthase [Saprospiraceae bacterium]|nr:dihydropteroate synthase [Saprospiraceae bacterium]
MLNQRTTINCKGKLLDLKNPMVMGILNLTPDSFYDGGLYQSDRNILKHVEKMLEEGAAIIDVGGMSSRPGAMLINSKEEKRRILPAIKMILKEFPAAILSVDTFRANVAKAAVDLGAAMINDISAGNLDKKLFDMLAQLDVPYILMHMQGTPKTMQNKPQYGDILVDILDFFIKKIAKLRALGIKDIIIDVGFGFGKELEDNYLLLQNLHAFQILELPLLAGLSRKSMIYKFLKITPASALPSTSALHMIALQQGAKILRAHDVGEAMQTIQLWQLLEKTKEKSQKYL